ncbi:MAG: HlyD family efflux transporter periplasmic adaptor subunit [Cyanobacteria bacterium J06639_14]
MVKTTFQEVDSDKAASIPEKAPEPSSGETQHRSWQRFVIGGACVSLGLLAVGIGIASISYRLTHLSIGSGLINGRTVRIQAPVDGTIRDFYARPGVEVKAGQVLTRLGPLPLTLPQSSPVAANLPNLPNLPDQTAAVQLESDQQTLDLLQQQLQELENQYQALQATTVTIAAETADQSQAAIAAAIAEEVAARKKYERFRTLLSAGAVSRQEVDELEAVWKIAQADVQQAQSEQAIAQVTVDALQQQTPLHSATKDLQFRRRQLLQEIQAQTARINLSESELQALQSEVEQTRIPAGNNTILPISAPFDGIVYSTQHDAGEQVDRSNVLLSLLDCNDLWVEALVSVEQANRINIDQPVRVQLAGQTDTVIGTVEFINAVSMGDLTKARAEALLPAVPAKLVNRPLARVRVRIPPTSVQTQTHQFCGVGQSANLTFGTHSFVSAWLGGFTNP